MTRTHTSWASSPAVAARMRAQARRDTKPEMQLRRELHRRRLRYRLHVPVPGAARRRIDIAFASSRVAVFVDGCFWHGCPEYVAHSHTHSDYWAAKIAANRQRDEDTDRRLSALGWRVIRVWEHEDVVIAADRVEIAVRRIQEMRKPDRAAAEMGRTA
jgi:DNA mismatch endonuclease, patch repair protein